MKLTQTDNQIEVKNNGIGQLLIGAVFFVAGIAVTALILSSHSSDGKKAPIWVVLFGLLFCVIGVFIAFMAQNRRTTIQKGSNVTVWAKRLLIGAPQEQSVPTSSVVAVRLTTSADYSAAQDGDTTNQRRSVLSLVLTNNDLIEVGSAGTKNMISINGMNVSNLISKAPLSKEANQLASFLGVPLQASDTSTIPGMVQSVKSAFQNDGSNGSGPVSPPTQTASFNPAAAVPPNTPAPQPQPPVSPVAPTPAAPAPPQPPQAPAPPAPPAAPLPPAPSSPMPTPPGPPAPPQS